MSTVALQFEHFRYYGAAEAARRYLFQRVRSASIGWNPCLQDMVRKHKAIKQTHRPEVQVLCQKADQLFVTSFAIRQCCP